MNLAQLPPSGMKLTADQRKAMIVTAGVDIANEFGLTACRALNVSARCVHETSIWTVRKYFLTNNDLWTAIGRHPNASPDVKKEAMSLGVI